MARVSMKEKIGYSLGDVAANFIFQAMICLQFSFYVDTYGLSPNQAANLFFVVGIAAAFFNPVMGMIADRTRSRWGRFRPWLLWTALPFGIVGSLTFFTPNFSDYGKVIYAWATYLLLRAVYTMNNVPYASITTVMTSDPDERTSISSVREIAATCASFVVSSLALPLVRLFGGGSDARGYQITMGILSCLGGALSVAAFLSTRERIQPTDSQQTSVASDIADLFRNRAWCAMFVATFFYFIAISLRGSVMLTYFRYYILDENLFSVYNGVGLGSLIVGIALSTKISIKLGKRRLYTASMIAVGGLSAALYLVPSGSPQSLIAIEFIRQICCGLSVPLLWSIMGDVADYGEWKTGRRAGGAVTSGIVFALWVGLAVGGATAGWVLGYFGFVANTANNGSAIEGIKLTGGIFPALAFFSAAAALSFYPIGKSLAKQITEELYERRREWKEVPVNAGDGLVLNDY